jgi:hypothetical protein
MLLSVYIDNTTAQMIKIIPVERGGGRWGGVERGGREREREKWTARGRGGGREGGGGERGT